MAKIKYDLGLSSEVDSRLKAVAARRNITFEAVLHAACALIIVVDDRLVKGKSLGIVSDSRFLETEFKEIFPAGGR